MAAINSQITVGETDILEVSSDPGAGAGTQAPLGTLAIVQDEVGQTGTLYQKTGPLDSDWALMQESNVVAGNVGGLFMFFNNAGSNNKWLRVFESNQQPSNIVMGLFPFDARVFGLTFFNEDDDSGGDVEIYKNGVLTFTWQIRNKRYAWKTNGLSAITFNAGDRISIFNRNVSGQNEISEMTVIVHYIFTSSATGEGGAQTMVNL